MTAITKQQLTRDLGQQHITLQMPTERQQSNLFNYQGVVEHGGRMYRISIMVPKASASDIVKPIAELTAIAGAHIQIEVFAMFAVARFDVPAEAGLH
ncbi:hypothetical protein ACR0ST_04235 [Aliidiomarina sp. Khilg15.8]